MPTSESPAALASEDGQSAGPAALEVTEGSQSAVPATPEVTEEGQSEGPATPEVTEEGQSAGPAKPEVTEDDQSAGPPTPDLTGAWLVVIDPQVIFADPTSEWCAPRFAEIVEPVRRLAEAFGDRVIVTRWVPPEHKVGSWVPYFQHFPFADEAPDHALFDLVSSAADLGARHTVSEPTFGKWGEQLRAITGPTPHLVLTGVATDCCVISTALPAVDAGATVTVVSDACAGSDDTNHQRALDAMALYVPQLFIRTTHEVLVPGGQ